MRKKLTVILFMTVLALGLSACGTSYVVNKPDSEKGKTVASGLVLYDSPDTDFCFLYPEGEVVSYSETDGVTVHKDQTENGPYLLVKKTEKKGMTPEKYFEASNKQILDTFEKVESTKIYETAVEEKTLYMTRYLVSDGAKEKVIERYIELYKDFYIQYTAISEQIGDLNTETYYAIKTLSMAEGAYENVFVDTLTDYTHPDTQMYIELPDALDVTTLTIGYMASSEDAIMLCVTCSEDDDGNAIKNRDDFLERASQNDGFVASYIGADTAEFGKGSIETIQGVEYYAYPMTLTFSGEIYNGKLVLANLTTGGCALGIYGVKNGCEHYEDYLNPVQKRMIASVPGVIKTGFRDFMEPEDYLQQYARQVLQVPVTPVARAALPSLFGKNLPAERNALLSFFQSHCININVRIEASNLVCDAILMKFSARLGNRNVVVLAGADWQGVEYYDANRGFSGIQSAFANPFSFAGTEKPKNFVDFFMKGGLVGQMMRNKNAAAQNAAAQNDRQTHQQTQTSKSIPLGHAREYGKSVDVVQWGSKRRYLMLAPVEKEQEATEIFLRFVGTLTPDPALIRQENALIEQMHQTRLMEAQGYAMQAQQMRMQAMQRQMEVSRQIARDSAEISAGIMDSWEKRSASQSRMSANYSEAIRGVNTYTTPSGGTVVGSVTADHVYQNRYGDTINVSGSAIDPDVAAKLDWTELNRK